MWIFSNHIEKRISERNILKNEILSIVNNDVDVLIIPSDRDNDIDLFFGFINNKYILVVANRITKVLVTTRKMRKNEVNAFKREVANE